MRKFMIGFLLLALCAPVRAQPVPGYGPGPAPSSGGTPYANPMLFCTGSDGALTMSSGTVTLTRDMCYSSITLSGTAVLNTAGWRVFASVKCDLSNAGAGAISANIVNGNNASGLTGGSAASPPSNYTILATTLNVYSPISGGGGSGTTTTGGSGSNASSGNSETSQFSGNGSSGGTGGLSTSNGGSGGNGASGNNTYSFPYNTPVLPFPQLTLYAFYSSGGVSNYSSFSIPSLLSGGGGGGAGGGDGTHQGGGGGSGAPSSFPVYLACSNLITTSGSAAKAISGIGGTGGNGANGTGGNAGGGAGGGGAGGGGIFLIVGTKTGNVVTDLVDSSGGRGGTGGNGAGTGANGVGGAGAAGGVIDIYNIGAGTWTYVAPGTAGSAGSGTTGGAGGLSQAAL